MIKGIPSAEDFKQAGLNLLNLAWIVAVKAIADLNEADGLFDPHYASEKERQIAHVAYWKKKQPALGNAFALVQQGIELGLKGRIAAISPYLLIARDARDYPTGSDQIDVEFSAFRSLDAADLFRIHNAHCPIRLGEDFRAFWDQVRRQRNALIHSVTTSKPIEAGEILSHVLMANGFLFGEVCWSLRRLTYHANDELAEFPVDDDISRRAVLVETETVLEWLSPQHAKLFYGFEKKQRSYLCPHCYFEVDHHFRDELPRLAQLRPKSATTTSLWCCVCHMITRVKRENCTGSPDCKSNVICADPDFGDMCLICAQ